MPKQDERSRNVSQWLTHLQRWKASGQPLSGYAKGCGVAVSALYYWRRVLIAEGCWRHGAGATSRTARSASGRRVQFARVAITDSAHAAPVRVRVVLANGRRAQTEFGGLERLGEVLGVLERAA